MIVWCVQITLKSIFPLYRKWHSTLTPQPSYIIPITPFWNQFSNYNYYSMIEHTFVSAPACKSTISSPYTMLSSQYINWAITLLFQQLRIIGPRCISPSNNVSGPDIRFMSGIPEGFSNVFLVRYVWQLKKEFGVY